MNFCRIGLLIWCNQLCRIEHPDLAESLGGDSRGFLSQTLSMAGRTSSSREKAGLTSSGMKVSEGSPNLQSLAVTTVDEIPKFSRFRVETKKER
jgi:hypothetical protein